MDLDALFHHSHSIRNTFRVFWFLEVIYCFEWIICSRWSPRNLDSTHKRYDYACVMKYYFTSVRWNFVNLRYGHIVEGVCGDAWQYWKWLPFSFLCLKIVTLILTTHKHYTTQPSARLMNMYRSVISMFDYFFWNLFWVAPLLLFVYSRVHMNPRSCFCDWLRGKARTANRHPFKIVMMYCVYWSLCFHE